MSATDATEPLESFDRSWQPVDLTEVLSGNYRPQLPTEGKRVDGESILYPGKEHSIVSEPEGGKTWFALSIAQDEMNAGNHVAYLDFEDDAGGIVGRLLVLGCSREVIAERFHYVRPSAAIGTGIHLDDLRSLLVEFSPTVVFLDGITEAMSLHGLDPLKNDDVANFGKVLAKRITASGAAVASLDHVTKSTDNRGRWAIGAQHKLSGINGAVFILENRTPFGIGRTGKTSIKISKDRPAHLRKNSVLLSAGGMAWFGDLILASHSEDFAEVSIEAPIEKAEEDSRPVHLMERIANALAKHGPLSQNDLRDVLKVKRETAKQALVLLQIEGYVSQTTPLELLQPYISGLDNG